MSWKSFDPAEPAAKKSVNGGELLGIAGRVSGAYS